MDKDFLKANNFVYFLKNSAFPILARICSDP
jgi:hypothetical protein